MKSPHQEKKKTLTLSVGFEFQTPDMAFGIADTSKPYCPNMIHHPSEFVSHTLFISDQGKYSIKVYGDKTTNDIVRRHLKTIQSRTRSFPYLTCPDTPYCFSSHDLVQILNDAEFVSTDTRHRRVKISDMCDFLCQQAVRHLSDILRLVKTFPTQKIGRVFLDHPDKRPRVFHDFPLKGSFYHHDSSILMTYDTTSLDDLFFYIQCTIGVSLKDVCTVLTTLATTRLMSGTVKDTKTCQMYTDIVALCDESSTHIPSDELTRSVYVLFMYHCLTYRRRKASPFIIRHLFSGLLKILSPVQFDCLVEHLPMTKKVRASKTEKVSYREYAQILYETRYIEYTQTLSHHDTRERLQNKMFQCVDDVSTFSFVDKGINTHILLEFRDFHHFFLSFFLKHKKPILVSLDMIDTHTHPNQNT